MKSNTRIITNELKKFMKYISSVLEIGEYIVYGGFPIDYLSNNGVVDFSKINDIDIAIKGLDERTISNVNKTLTHKGFEIIEARREYYIYKTHKVILLYAKNEKWNLDIAFLENPEEIGQFNVESLYITYPGFCCVDKFHCLDGIRNRKVSLIRNFHDENPNMLLARYLYLVSKYNVTLNCEDLEFINRSKISIDKWHGGNDFHDRISKIALMSYILKAIAIRTDKHSLLEVLINAQILSKQEPFLFDSLTLLLKNCPGELSNIKSKLDLVLLLVDKCQSSYKQNLIKELLKLKLRKWDKVDTQITNILEVEKYVINNCSSL